MASLDTLHLTFADSVAQRYPSVIDQLLRLPVSCARNKISQDVRTFLRMVLTQGDSENALFELYGPPEIPPDQGEFCWQTIEAEDRRRTEFYALLVGALGA